MKKILLIGGSYGIGAAIAELLSNEHEIHIASRSNDSIPDGVQHHTFDVTKDAITDLNLPERLDGLVYCPGSINLKPFKMLSEDAFQNDLDINFIGLVKTVHALLPRLKKSEQASLVFFSTVAVATGMPFHTSVAAAKGAIEGFAKALAAEYAPNFRVNVIAPSLTDTPLAGNLLNSEEKKVKMGDKHPLKRVGNTNDIAQAARFLLTNDASWVTGQILRVDGGMSTLNV